MNVMKFIVFCYASKIPDPKKLPVSKLDEIFNRVNLEEVICSAQMLATYIRSTNKGEGVVCVLLLVVFRCFLGNYTRCP